MSIFNIISKFYFKILLSQKCSYTSSSYFASKNENENVVIYVQISDIIRRNLEKLQSQDIINILFKVILHFRKYFRIKLKGRD